MDSDNRRRTIVSIWIISVGTQVHKRIKVTAVLHTGRPIPLQTTLAITYVDIQYAAKLVFTCTFTESYPTSFHLFVYLSLFFPLCAPNLMQVSHCLSPVLSSHRTPMHRDPRKKTQNCPFSNQYVCVGVSLSNCEQDIPYTRDRDTQA